MRFLPWPRRVLSMLGLVGVICVSGCTVDLLTRDRYVSFDFNGTAVKVRCNEVVNSFDLQPLLSGSDFEYRVLSARRLNGITYALLNVVGDSSKTKSDACAGGRERSLVWLKLNSDLAAVEARSVLVESCLQKIESDGVDTRAGSRLTVNYFTDSMTAGMGQVIPRRLKYTFEYDDAHPERGFVIKQAEISGLGR